MSKTTTIQRIAIWIIMIFMVLSTIALYASMILSQKNTQAEQAKLVKLETDFNNNVAIQAAKVEERVAAEVTPKIKELSDKYYSDFSPYQSRASAFNSASIKELQTDDIKIGDGSEITDEFTDYNMYYIGWKPDGTIFDSSISGESLKEPSAGSRSYIEGWSEGVIGMKIGGVRQITIPSDKAYGSSGSGTEGQDGYIAPDTPLKFIVMAIPKTKTRLDISAEIPYPKGTYDLCKQYAIQRYGEDMLDYICSSHSNEEE